MLFFADFCGTLGEFGRIIMKVLGTLAIAVMALVGVTFASAAPAKADDFGVYIGSDGFGLQFSNHGG